MNNEPTMAQTIASIPSIQQQSQLTNKIIEILAAKCEELDFALATETGTDSSPASEFKSNAIRDAKAALNL